MRFKTLLPMLVVAACVSKPPAPPPPRPQPPAPRPLPPPPLAESWEDRAIAPGIWVYRSDARGGIAFFGQPGADADLLLRCDLARHRVYISRPGAIAGPMTLRSTTAAKSYQAVPTGAVPPYVAADLDPRDPVLDALAFSRGRMMISVAGSDLIAPAWPEFTRVVEDCRAP